MKSELPWPPFLLLYFHEKCNVLLILCFDSLLSRAHSNYLAQINIRTSERAEQTNDVLNKLTVLSTIVLPLNIVTGIWGMNCWIPGLESVEWFFGIIGGMLLFSVICLGIARRKGLI